MVAYLLCGDGCVVSGYLLTSGDGCGKWLPTYYVVMEVW